MEVLTATEVQSKTRKPGLECTGTRLVHRSLPQVYRTDAKRVIRIATVFSLH